VAGQHPKRVADRRRAKELTGSESSIGFNATVSKGGFMHCDDLKTKVDNLIGARREVIVQLHTERDPVERARLIHEFKLISQQLALERIRLEICLQQDAGMFPLETLFNGSFVLRTTFSDAPGPFEGDLELGVHFNASRTQLSITSFPEIIVGPFETPFGDNVTTVRKISGGSGMFNASNGSAAVPLSLRFDHSIDIPFFEEDSTFPISLTTGRVADLQGSPLNRTTRKLTLVGRGRFNGGIMGGSSGDLIVSGTLATLP
jgi:hypothetical protein